MLRQLKCLPVKYILASDSVFCVTEWGKVGVGIGYDLRFPELAALYAQKGIFNLMDG